MSRKIPKLWKWGKGFLNKVHNPILGKWGNDYLKWKSTEVSIKGYTKVENMVRKQEKKFKQEVSSLNSKNQWGGKACGGKSDDDSSKH